MKGILQTIGALIIAPFIAFAVVVLAAHAFVWRLFYEITEWKREDDNE